MKCRYLSEGERTLCRPKRRSISLAVINLGNLRNLGCFSPQPTGTESRWALPLFETPGLIAFL